MAKVLLFSQNEILAEKIKHAVISENMDFSLQSFSEPVNDNIEAGDLIIIDISSLDLTKNSYYYDFLKKLAPIESIKLLILEKSQEINLTNVLDTKINLNDIIFKSQLDNELKTRIEFLTYAVPDKLSANYISVGELILNLDKYELTIKGKAIELTFKEYELLRLLLENQNKVFTRNKLLSIIWGYNFYGGSRTVDVHMRRLRTKLESPYHEMLKTVRNVGYMFSPNT